jgi:hypothetical protein
MEVRVNRILSAAFVGLAFLLGTYVIVLAAIGRWP